MTSKEQLGTLIVTGASRGIGAAVATLAHTLKGSASGVGAGRVERAAAEAELAADSPDHECDRAIERLAQAVEEARALIAELLQAR